MHARRTSATPTLPAPFPPAAHRLRELPRPEQEESDLRSVLGTVIGMLIVLVFLIALLITLDFGIAWLVSGNAY